MTITITLPNIRVPAVTGSGLRRLLPLARPAVCAVADAYGVGVPVRLAMDLGAQAARYCARS